MRVDRARYARASAVFRDAVELEGAARDAFVAAAAGGDEELRALVMQLLDFDRNAGSSDGPVLVDRDRVLSVLEPPRRARAEREDGDRDPVEPTVPSEVPDAVGKYRIIGHLGAGGMAVVYLAEQDAPRRRVALKVIRPGTASAEVIRRFRLEGEMHGQLTHDGIAQVHETGVAELLRSGAPGGEVAYIAMELVDGQPLDIWVARRAPPRELRLTVLALIADAVAHAHSHGVVHRDLKPSNILITEQDRPKVIDFGVARAMDSETLALRTAAGQLVGTLSYMSPEQVSGRAGAIDERSDVYALGVVLYELLSGHLPYDLGESSIGEAARVIQEADPIRLSATDLSLRGDLENIVAKALEKERERRYPSAAALAADVRRFLADEPVVARPVSAIYLVKKFARRNRPLVLGAAAAVVSLIAAVVVSVNYAVKADREAVIARVASERAADSAYVAAVRSAVRALDDDDLPGLQEALSLAPADRRDWEWRYLAARLGRTRAYYANNAFATFRPDGELVIALARDGQFRIVTPGTETAVVLEPSTSLAGPSDSRPGDLAMSADGTRVAAQDGTHFVVWDAGSGKILVEHAFEAGPIYKQAFSPNGRHALLQLRDDRVVLFDVDAARVLHARVDRGFMMARFSADGRRAFILAGGCLRTVDVKTGETTSRLEVPAASTQFALRADERELALICAHDRALDVVGADSSGARSVVPAAPYGPTADVWAVGLSYLGDDVVVRSDPEDRLLFVDLASGRTQRSIPTPVRVIWGLEVARDQSRVVAFGRGGAFVVDLPALRQPKILAGHGAALYAVAVSPDGSLVASGGWDHIVRIWEASRGRLLATHPTGTGYHDVWQRTAVQGLGFAANGFELTGWAFQPRSWDPVSGTRRDEGAPGDWEEYCDSISSARLSSYNDGIAIVSSGDGSLRARVEDRPGKPGERMVVVTDRRAGTRRELPFAADCVALNPDRRRVAFASVTGLRIADQVTGEVIARMDRRYEFLVLEFSPDGRRLVSGTRDGAIRFWDASTLGLVATLRGHEDYVYSLRFSPDGTRLFSAGGDGTVRIWDTVDTVQRRREADALAARRDRMDPLVDTWSAEEADPRRVLDRAAADPALDPLDRRAVLHRLIERASK